MPSYTIASQPPSHISSLDNGLPLGTEKISSRSSIGPSSSNRNLPKRAFQKIMLGLKDIRFFRKSTGSPTSSSSPSTNPSATSNKSKGAKRYLFWRKNLHSESVNTANTTGGSPKPSSSTSAPQIPPLLSIPPLFFVDELQLAIPMSQDALYDEARAHLILHGAINATNDFLSSFALTIPISDSRLPLCKIAMIEIDAVYESLRCLDLDQKLKTSSHSYSIPPESSKGRFSLPQYQKALADVKQFFLNFLSSRKLVVPEGISKKLKDVMAKLEHSEKELNATKNILITRFKKEQDQ